MKHASMTKLLMFAAILLITGLVPVHGAYADSNRQPDPSDIGIELIGDWQVVSISASELSDGTPVTTVVSVPGRTNPMRYTAATGECSTTKTVFGPSRASVPGGYAAEASARLDMSASCSGVVRWRLYLDAWVFQNGNYKYVRQAQSLEATAFPDEPSFNYVQKKCGRTSPQTSWRAYPSAGGGSTANLHCWP